MNNNIELDDHDENENNDIFNDEKPKKSISSFIVVAVLALAFFGWQIYKGINNFSFFGKKAETKKETVQARTRTFTLPPLPKPKKVKEELVLRPDVEKPAAPIPLPVVIQQEKIEEPVEPVETITDKRYKSAKSSLNDDFFGKNITDTAVNSKLINDVYSLDNPDYLLLEGTKISCTLETKIVSDFSGGTSCIINKDIYSMNARILLIEKGSKFLGDYKNNVLFGQDRVNVVWYRIITPENLSVNLGAKGTDNLGGIGLVAHVNNRWGQRIGAALLVSFSSDLFDFLANKEQDSKGDNNQYVYSDSETADTTKDISEQILEKTINVKPTLTVMNGKTINITVNKDIDFSEIYDVK